MDAHSSRIFLTFSESIRPLSTAYSFVGFGFFVGSSGYKNSDVWRFISYHESMDLQFNNSDVCRDICIFPYSFLASFRKFIQKQRSHRLKVDDFPVFNPELSPKVMVWCSEYKRNTTQGPKAFTQASPCRAEMGKHPTANVTQLVILFQMFNLN